MRIISFINLKGGVAKTVSAINFAYILSQKGYRVLLIDADKQGNTTKFFNLLDYDAPSMSDILTKRGIAVSDVAQPTAYENLHVVPANMSLLTANRTVLLDTARAQQTRLKKALQPQWDDYDFCIIDHAPDIDMAAINGLCVADDVLIPVTIDEFSLDGLDILAQQIAELQEDHNPKLRLAGCFVTMWQKNNLNRQGVQVIAQSGYPYFKTVIRRSVKVGETTFTHAPLAVYAPQSTAAQDYEALVNEYVSNWTRFVEG